MRGFISRNKNVKPPREKKKLVVAGPPMAGKTTILRYLSGGEFQFTRPTFGFDVEELTFRGMRITAVDLGGQEAFVHALWKQMIVGCDAIAFVVDAASEQSIKKAQYLMDFIARWIEGVPFVLCANKQDLPHARPPEELIMTLNLVDIFIDANIRHFRVLGTSAVTGEGIREAFEWLFDQMAGVERPFLLEHVHQILVYNKESGLPLAQLADIKKDVGTDDAIVVQQEENLVRIMLGSLKEAVAYGAFYSAIDTFAHQLGTKGVKSLVLKVTEDGSGGLRLVLAERGELSCLVVCDEVVGTTAARQFGEYILERIENEYQGNFRRGSEGIVMVEEQTFASFISRVITEYDKFFSLALTSKSK